MEEKGVMAPIMVPLPENEQSSKARLSFCMTLGAGINERKKAESLALWYFRNLTTAEPIKSV